jgi:hypothetical protein
MHSCYRKVVTLEYDVTPVGGMRETESVNVGVLIQTVGTVSHPVRLHSEDEKNTLYLWERNQVADVSGIVDKWRVWLRTTSKDIPKFASERLLMGFVEVVESPLLGIGGGLITAVNRTPTARLIHDIITVYIHGEGPLAVAAVELLDADNQVVHSELFAERYADTARLFDNHTSPSEGVRDWLNGFCIPAVYKHR